MKKILSGALLVAAALLGSVGQGVPTAQAACNLAMPTLKVAIQQGGAPWSFSVYPVDPYDVVVDAMPATLWPPTVTVTVTGTSNGGTLSINGQTAAAGTSPSTLTYSFPMGGTSWSPYQSVSFGITDTCLGISMGRQFLFTSTLTNAGRYTAGTISSPTINITGNTLTAQGTAVDTFRYIGTICNGPSTSKFNGSLINPMGASSLPWKIYSNTPGSAPVLTGSYSLALTSAGSQGCTCDTCNDPNNNFYNYSLTQDISSLAPGTYQLIIPIQSGPETLYAAGTFTYGSSGGGAATGTIVVASNNSVVGTPVPSSWNFSAYPSTDPCTLASCNSVSQQTFTNVPATVGGVPGASYTLQPTANSAGAQYVYKDSYINAFAAYTPKVPLTVLDLLKQFAVPVANAVVHQSAGFPWSQTLNPGMSITMGVLWDPVAALAAAPATVALTSAVPGAPVTLSNSGAPGSTAAWTASVSYTGPTTGWLSVSPTSGSLANGASGSATKSVSFVANTASLPVGIYNANVTFAGVSTPGSKGPLSVVVPVSLNVSAVSSVPSVSISAAPTSVGLGSNSTLTWSSVNATACTASGAWSGSVPVNGSQVVTPTIIGANNYTIRCTGPGGTSAPATAVVTATTAGPPPPSCTFTANPTQIIPPSVSNLSYSCLHVTSCNLIGGQFGAAPGTPLSIVGTTLPSATQPVSPPATTLYTLSCQGLGAGVSYQTNLNVNVVVSAPGRIETNP